MDYQTFYRAYLKYTGFRYLLGALISLVSGVLMITLGVFMDLGFVILSGFGLIFLFMILLIYSGIKTTALSHQKIMTLIDSFWTPLLQRLTPMDPVKLKIWPKEEKAPQLPLLDIIAPNPSHKVIYYTFTKDRVEGFALNYYTVRTTGQAAASYENFRGYYLRIPTTSTSPLSVRKDPLAFIKKYRRQEDPDGSDKYQVQPASNPLALSLIEQLEAFGFRHFDVVVEKGYLEVTIPLWHLIPTVSKDEKKSKQRATDHLEQLIRLINWMKATQERLENQIETS